ncbi:MAG: hypothetical protein ACFCD0_23470 [Gemmataceae bacterium]
MTIQTTSIREAILVLGGAFSPVHPGHIDVMNLIKETIEAEHPYKIIAGYLAVAPEGYVLSKLKHQAIKAQHRLAMCNLALQEHDWLVPCERTHGSARECAQRYRKHDDVKILIALGADRAMSYPEYAKWRWAPFDGTITVCVGRKGETERVLQQYQHDLEQNLVEDPNSFLFVTQEVGNVSSSLIRERLQILHNAPTPEQKQKLAEQLVEARCLNPLVAEYILEHERNLYVG